MAFNYNKKVWGIDKEVVDNLPPMDVWRDIDGNEIDFEAELAKGHTGFLYMVYFPNGQLYPGSKQIDLNGSNNVFDYYGSGKLGGEYVDEYGTDGIKRTVLKFHSGNRDELYNEEERFLKESNVVFDDKFLNLTDEAGFMDFHADHTEPMFGEIIATDLNDKKYYFENEHHAAEELEKIKPDNPGKFFKKKITTRMIRFWLLGSSVAYEKFLKDIRVVGTSIVEDKELDKKRDEKREKMKSTTKKQSEAHKKRFEDPKEREKQSEISKKMHADNPEVRKKIGRATTKRYENQEERNKHSEKLKKFYRENPEKRTELSEIQKISYVENPDRAKKQSKAHKKRFEDPKEREKQSEISKKMHADNPEIRKKAGENNKKEGKIYFNDGRVEKFKGQKDGAKKADVKFSIFTRWTNKIQSKTFRKKGILKIEYGGRIIQ